jgi:hypothetical protein
VELKPCICGKKEASIGTVQYSTKSQIAIDNGQNIFYYVNCPYCGWNNRGLIGFNNEASAAKHWNNRPIEESLQSKLDVAVQNIKDNNYAWDRIANKKTSAIRADELCAWANAIIKSNDEALCKIEGGSDE